MGEKVKDIEVLSLKTCVIETLKVTALLKKERYMATVKTEGDMGTKPQFITVSNISNLTKGGTPVEDYTVKELIAEGVMEKVVR